METVRELIPPRARMLIYAAYILAGLSVGAFAVATSGDVAWVETAERVLAYLAVPMAILAGTNVPDNDGPTGYVARYAKD